MTKPLRSGWARAATLALMATAWMPAPARAEDWEISGGYAMLRETKDQITFPVGWTAGVARRLNPWLSIVADVDGQRKAIPSIGSDIVLTSHALSAGGRASKALGQFSESAQVTIGVLRAEGDAFGSSSTSTSLAIQPGLGLQYPTARRWSVRAGVDLRLIHTGEQVRVTAVVVYRP